ETGRPVETINNDYNETAQIVLPSPVGGHNWMPMAFSPLTELVYIPAIDLPHTYAGDPQYPHIGADWQTGTNPSYAATPKEIGPDVERALLKKLAQARLIAWNPKTQTSAWSVEHKHPWNGGVLATGGNLVFQGDALGFFSAYTADTGTLLWQQAANTGIVAAPISYSIDGEQYVAVLAGWGGSMALFGGEANRLAQGGVTGRMLVYKLGANGLAPAGFAVQERELPTSKSLEGVTQAQLTNGFDLYNAHCMVCHGFGVVGGGLIPDLRYVNDATYQIFERIVGEGLLAPVGMPSFAGRLGEQEILNIKAYVTREAMREREDRNDPDWWRATKQTLGMAVAWLLTSL
ncbi:MAG: c-type cytochrome, partial [Pseudomonadota bacterium]